MDGLTLLRRAQEAGLAVEAHGDRLVIRGPKRAASIARLLIDHKSRVLAALPPHDMADVTADGQTVATRSQWHDSYAARIVHWFGHGRRSWEEAERLAFGDLILAWHRRHGARARPGRCAGCGDDLPDDGGLTIDRNGVRVHFDGVRGADCVIAYGTSWRGAAVAGLQTLRLHPPGGFELL